MKSLFKRIWESIKYQVTTQDIVILMIIVFLMIWIFSGCTDGQNHKGSLTVYEYKYDSCVYIRIRDQPLIHSATCNNPKHTIDTIVIKEVIEFK